MSGEIIDRGTNGIFIQTTEVLSDLLLAHPTLIEFDDMEQFDPMPLEIDRLWVICGRICCKI